MEQGISPEQFQRLVGEVEQLTRQQQNQLSELDVKNILVELNLSPALLEQARLQLRRRDALLQQRRRRRRQLAVLCLVACLVTLGFVLVLKDQQAAFASVRAQAARLTPEPGPGTPKRISLQALPELVFRVTLRDAPVGRRLPLACDWLAPDGVIVKQNRYLTQVITTPVWDTHCRLQTHASLPAGSWRVRMWQDKRLLREQPFELR